MTKKPNRPKVCVYCGSRQRLGVDHIPPQCLFSSPRPQNTITVPCCHDCNSRFSKDDVYFRDHLSLWQEISDHPESQKIAESVLRSFKDQKQQKYTRSLFRNVVDVNIISKGGIYLGKGKGLKIDPRRIARVPGRIVRGLFFHEYGEILPSGHCVVVIPLVEEYFANTDQRKSISEVCGSLTSTPRTTIGQGVFSYWHHLDADSCYRSMWLLLFYGKMSFLGMTPEKETIPHDLQAIISTISTV